MSKPFFLPLALALSAAGAAHADDTPRLADRLTERGRLLVGGAISGQWYSNRLLPAWMVQIAPSAAYFVRDGLGLGGTVQYTRQDGDLTAWALGPAIYYDWVLAERVSILLSVSALGGRASAPGSDSSGAVILSAAAPVMFHASDSVAIGMGPRVAESRYFFSDASQSDGRAELFDRGGVEVGLGSAIVATF